MIFESLLGLCFSLKDYTFRNLIPVCGMFLECLILNCFWDVSFKCFKKYVYIYIYFDEVLGFCMLGCLKSLLIFELNLGVVYDFWRSNVCFFLPTSPKQTHV